MGRAEQCVAIVGVHFCGCGDENVFGKHLISPDENGSELWENCDGMQIKNERDGH